MNSLTADESMLARFRGIVEPVEIRDPSGNLLGHYTPAVSPEVAAQYGKALELFDLEEAKQVAATERHWLQIQEVMKHIFGRSEDTEGPQAEGVAETGSEQGDGGVRRKLQNALATIAVPTAPSGALALQQRMAESGLGPNELSRALMDAREE